MYFPECDETLEQSLHTKRRIAGFHDELRPLEVAQLLGHFTVRGTELLPFPFCDVPNITPGLGQSVDAFGDLPDVGVLDLARDDRRGFVFGAHVGENAAADDDVAARQREAALDAGMWIIVNTPRQF